MLSQTKKWVQTHKSVSKLSSNSLQVSCGDTIVNIHNNRDLESEVKILQDGSLLEIRIGKNINLLGKARRWKDVNAWILSLLEDGLLGKLVPLSICYNENLYFNICIHE